MRTTKYSDIINRLELAYNDALRDAANHADVCEDSESVYCDGYAAGIKCALDIIAAYEDPDKILIL